MAPWPRDIEEPLVWQKSTPRWAPLDLSFIAKTIGTSCSLLGLFRDGIVSEPFSQPRLSWVHKTCIPSDSAFGLLWWLSHCRRRASVGEETSTVVFIHYSQEETSCIHFDQFVARWELQQDALAK